MVGSLKFEDHLAEQIWLHGDSDFARSVACQQHALVIFNPLRDAAMHCVKVASLLDAPAAHYLRHGAARRFLMTWYAYRTLIFSAPANRTNPISHDELAGLERDLNVIYFNLVGILDNYAWALLKQFESQVRLPPQKVGLFSKSVLEQPHLMGLREVVEPYCDWNQDLRKRRDPVAHRIPLTIPPAILSREEAEEYKRLDIEYAEALRALNLDAASSISNAQGRLGNALLVFLHDPAEKPVPLYPTMPSDIAAVLDLSRLLNDYASDKLVGT